MLLVVLIELFLIVFLALLNLHDLGGAGLARHPVADVLPDVVPSRAVLLVAHVAAVHDFLHRVHHPLPIVGRWASHRRQRRQVVLEQGLVAGKQQPRPHPLAPIGEDGSGCRSLQRGDQQVALADADVDIVARIPRLALGAPFPFRVRHQPGGSAIDVHRGHFAVTELADEAGELIGLQAVAQGVEEDVR